MKLLLIINTLLLFFPLFAQKKLLPANVSASSGISLPEGSKQDSRGLFVASAKTMLEIESKKDNIVMVETEVLNLPSQKKSGYTADSLMQSLKEQGWQIFPLTNDTKYAWLLKDSSYLLIYYSFKANTTELFFGKPGSSPVLRTAKTANPETGSSSAESKMDAGSANDKFNNTVTGIQFKAPDGWITKKKPDGTTALESPLLSCKQNTRFTIYILGFYPAQNNLQQQAIQYFESVFNGNGPNIKMKKGIAEGGWEYFLYQTDGFIGKNDHLFRYPGIYLAKTGKQVAVFGIESNRTEFKEYFGIALEDCKEAQAAWNKFLSTLQFSGLDTNRSFLPAELTGKWESRILKGVSWGGLPQSEVVNQYEFFSNGSYQSLQAFNGTKKENWKITGNKIIFSGTNNSTVTCRFTLESEFSYGSWGKKLLLYDANNNVIELYYKGN